MRLLKFFGAFFITAVLIFGFVLGWNWKSFTTFLENRDALSEGIEWVPKSSSLRGLSEFMAENPEYASVASVVVGRPDSSIFFEADRPRIMGTTSNFFILAEYAIQLAVGTLTGDELLSVDDISKYMLPEIENSVHREAFRVANQRGWLNDGQISLENALYLLAEYNDFALADYLWWKAGTPAWTGLPEIIGTDFTEMPLPYSGLYQAISPGLQNQPYRDIENRWLNAPETEWREHIIQLSSHYMNDDERRSQVQNYLRKNRLGNTFTEERDAMILFPKTTALEITNLLEKLVQNEFVNEETSILLKDFMRWPMNNQQGIERDLEDYGALYDNRMGLMNGIDFGTSAYTADITVQAFFLDRLPIGFWFHASGGHMHQDFMQRLIYDPAMIVQMKNVVEP